MKLRFLLLSLIITNTYADNLNVKYGVPVLHSAGTGIFGSVGYQQKLFRSVSHQIEGGVWSSLVPERGIKSSGFISYSLGIVVDINPIYAESMHGLGFITHKDKILGGHFQFFQDAGIGLKASDGSSFGLQWKHVSSAGIYSPNLGRDFILLKFSLGI